VVFGIRIHFSAALLEALGRHAQESASPLPAADAKND
jgi:hypothetical protein